jgi:subtilase family serine protease
MLMHAGLRKSLLILALIIAPVCTLHAASDLVVTTVAIPPASVALGAKVSLTSTVTNQGDASSPKTMIQYYLAPGPSKEDGWLLTGKRSVKELAPRATYTGKAKITVPSGIPSGTYYLLACVDDTNQAIEDNEDNNCTPSSAPVDLTAPDLVITDLSGLPATSPLKAVLSLTTSVKNEGTLASGPSRTYYYWSLDQTLTQAVRAAKQSVPPINPGEVSTPSVSLKAPKTPGTYYLLACADGANKVIEEDDENNCLSSSTAIIVGLPAISFSSTTDMQKIDSLPPGTTTINLTFDGVTREAPASGTTLIAFLSPDGDHTYSAQALS